jgi:hypothetical protein
MAILQNTTVSGSLVITGDLTARQFILSSSVTFFTESFASGSTRFGDSMDDTMVVTGSLRLTGSLVMTGSATVNGTASFQTVGNNGIINIGGSTYYSQLETNSNLGGLKLKSIWGGANSGVIQLINGTNENVRMHITDGGNIGIGTTNPEGILMVKKDTDGDTPIIFLNGSGGSGNTNASITLDFRLQNGTGGSTGGVKLKVGKETDHQGANVNDYFSISTSRSDAMAERLRIASTGNVAIGSTDTSYGKLYLVGYGAANSLMTQPVLIASSGANAVQLGSDGTNALIGAGNSGTSLILLSRQAGEYAEAIRITGDGTINMNTTSGNKLVTVKGQTGNGYYGEVRMGNVDHSAGIIGKHISGGNANLEFWTEYYSSGGYQKRMTIDYAGNIGAPTGTNIYNASDIRLKQNITAITDGLSKVNALNPVKFNWIDGFVESEDGKDMLGFIAQEVQDIIPQAVEGFNSGNTINFNDLVIDNPLRVNEKFIIPVLVKAIQELSDKVTALETT